MKKTTDEKVNSRCVAAVLIFMKPSLKKPKNNFVQLMNKPHFFLVYIINVEWRKIECPTGTQRGRNKEAFAIFLFLLKEMNRNR